MTESLEAQLRATLKHDFRRTTWYATSIWRAHLRQRASCGLRWAPERSFRFGMGTDTSPAWDSPYPFSLHPEDQEENAAGLVRVSEEPAALARWSFRARNAEGGLSLVPQSRGAPSRSKRRDDPQLDRESTSISKSVSKPKSNSGRSKRVLSRRGETQPHWLRLPWKETRKRLFWSEEAARIYGYAPGTEPTPESDTPAISPRRT